LVDQTESFAKSNAKGMNSSINKELKRKLRNMILTKEVEIKVSSSNWKHLEKNGYNIKKNGDIILINVEHLSPGSKLKIEVCCDNCSSNRNIPYCDYYNSIQKYKNYYCKNCRYLRMTETCMKIYGVDNYSKTEEYKLKFKKTCLEKYGVENPLQYEEFLNKLKKTNLERYGTNFTFENDIISKKAEESCLTRHGVRKFIQRKDFNIIYEESCMKKYGVSNAQQVSEIRNKTKLTRIERGLDIDDIFLSEFEIYKRKVRALTRKNREILLEIWNGTDYYDGEYIKDNFDLEYIDPKYPTIDHKISIFDGFKEGFTSEEISSLDNLCFTKRGINSSKNSLSEIEYKQKNQS
jgi:hypothetical protein